MLTMSSTPERVPAFDDLYREIQRLPQGITGQILIPGVLTTMSRPGAAHHRAYSHCRSALDRFDQELGGHGWWIRQEFEIRFPGDRLAVPDLAGWRADLHPELPDDNPLRIVPTWCAEVLSPSTASDDRTLKLPLYASTGVGHVWFDRSDAPYHRGVRGERRAADARRHRTRRGRRPVAAVRCRALARDVVEAARRACGCFALRLCGGRRPATLRTMSGRRSLVSGRARMGAVSLAVAIAGGSSCHLTDPEMARHLAEPSHPAEPSLCDFVSKQSAPDSRCLPTPSATETGVFGTKTHPNKWVAVPA